MPRVVHVYWTFPKTFESAMCCDEANGLGVYQIYRQFGSCRTLLYIGLVKSDRRDFYIRMNEHRKDWLSTKRGVIYIRFGYIRGFRGTPMTTTLIEEVEGALIFAMQPPENSRKKFSYTRREDLIVKNFGYRGDVPRAIDTTEHRAIGCRPCFI